MSKYNPVELYGKSTDHAKYVKDEINKNSNDYGIKFLPAKRGSQTKAQNKSVKFLKFLRDNKFFNTDKDLYIYEDKNSELVASLEKPKGNENQDYIKIEHGNIDKFQNNIDFIYDLEEINKSEIENIFKIKADIEKATTREMKDKLTQKGSYLVFRAEAPRIINDDGTLHTKGEVDIFYFANFPDLSRTDKPDFKEWGATNSRGKFIFESETLNGKQVKRGYLSKEGKEKFIKKCRKIILLQAELASKHEEGIDILTPNAFLDGLTAKEKQNANILFAKAATEACLVISKINKQNPDNSPFKNLKSLHFHDIGIDGFQNEFSKKSNKITIPIFVSSKFDNEQSVCKSAANKASKKLKGNKVASCVMGNVLSKIGNGAFSDFGTWGAEENDIRRYCMLYRIANSEYNTIFFEQVKYVASKISDFLNPKKDKLETSNQVLKVDRGMGNLNCSDQQKSNKDNYFNLPTNTFISGVVGVLLSQAMPRDFQLAAIGVSSVLIVAAIAMHILDVPNNKVTNANLNNKLVNPLYKYN